MKAGLILAGLALTLAACGTTYDDRAERPDPLADYVLTGEVVDCLPTYRIRESDALDDWTILFTMEGGDMYANRLAHRCPQLGFEDSFGYTLRGVNSLCDLDFITVLRNVGGDPLSPGASCGLGKFEKVEKRAETGAD